MLSIDKNLKSALLKVLNFCKSKIVPLPDLLPGDPNNELLKSVLNFGQYKKCILIEGAKACQEYERTKYFGKLL